MGRCRFIALRVAVAGLVLAAAMALFRPYEPTYQGRELSSWLRMKYGREDEVRTAVRHIGSNALPYLIAKLKSQDGPLRKHVSRFFPDQGCGCHRPRFRVAYHDWFEAARGFEMLGPASADAIPELERLLYDEERARPVAMALVGIGWAALPSLTNSLAGSNTHVRRCVIQQLAGLGAPAIPALVRSLKDPDISASVAAAHALAAPTLPSTAAANEVVPALCSSLKDTSIPALRNAALSTLAKYGRRATGALPEVLDALQDPVPSVRKAATDAFFRIHPTPLPTMLARLQHPHPLVRQSVAQGLGSHWGRDPLVMSALTNRLTDEDPGVRAQVAKALQGMDRQRGPRLKVPLAGE